MIKQDKRFLRFALILLVLLNIITLIQKSWAQDKYLPVRQDTSFSSWGVMPTSSNIGINLKNLPPLDSKKDVTVAVIDTGIDFLHPFLKDNIIASEGKKGALNFGRDFSKYKKSDFTPVDEHGHGTHVASIIKSVFPNVKLLALKYYEPRATGKENLKSTIDALKFAIDSNVDVINYSGGGPEASKEELLLLKEAEKKGILVVTAAGNEMQNLDGGGRLYYPASYGLKNVITVTTYDETLKVHPSSNFGKETVDIAAPGDRIKGAIPHGRAGYLTGTSQATAFVSGVAAMIKMAHPDYTPEMIKKIIQKSAKKEKSLQHACNSGGRLDAKAAIVEANKLDKSSTSNGRTFASTGKIIYRFQK